MELTIQQHANLFRAIIKCYNVRAAYGAGMTMTIDGVFVDWFCVFGDTPDVYTQGMIAPFWKLVIKGAWLCPLDNDFVKLVMSKYDWDRV